MKNIFQTTILVLLISMVVTTSFGQKVENAIFWEVSENGLSSPSYIYGTIKFISSKNYFLNKEVKNKLKKSKIFATEILLDHHNLHELNKAAHLPHRQSLKDLLSEKHYSDLKKIFSEKLKISNLKFKLVYSQFKPVILSTVMTRLSLGKEVMYYEQEFIKIANKNDLLTIGLETASREIAAIESFSQKNQVKALVHTIENFDEQLRNYEKLVEAYKLENLYKTLEYTLHPSQNDEDFKKAFFDQRNVDWIPQMEKYMKQKTSFFALGVAHLGDESGIINLLRKKGYTVKPIPLK